VRYFELAMVTFVVDELSSLVLDVHPARGKEAIDYRPEVGPPDPPEITHGRGAPR
jgi:hypothetical protein